MERVKDDSKDVKVDESNFDETAEILGIASIKYFDLKQNRMQNYKFDFDKMLDPKGNTGVYLEYQYVRICSILRKGGYEDEAIEKLAASGVFKITNESERNLAMTMLRLQE